MLARTPEECLLPSLDKPSLEGLSYLLRHPEQWPLGFEWDYGKCETCAMGLAHNLWGIFSESTQRGLRSNYGTTSAIFDARRAFEMEYDAAGFIFGALHAQVDSFRDVTPIIVADAIDAYLARRG